MPFKQLPVPLDSLPRSPWTLSASWIALLSRQPQGQSVLLANRLLFSVECCVITRPSKTFNPPPAKSVGFQQWVDQLVSNSVTVFHFKQLTITATIERPFDGTLRYPLSVFGMTSSVVYVHLSIHLAAYMRRPTLFQLHNAYAYAHLIDPDSDTYPQLSNGTKQESAEWMASSMWISFYVDLAAKKLMLLPTCFIHGDNWGLTMWGDRQRRHALLRVTTGSKW
ncbi:hypothetical protein EDD85DRAFT_996996 [Armillaria nabsnona]|nr:hypothetical protein EDD85DRAFT_996996 [Armillaria nabsnona]